MYQNPIGVKYRYFGTLARLQGVKRSSKIRDCSLYIIQKNTNFSISKFLLCFKLKQKSTYISNEWRLLSAEWATKQNCIKFRMHSRSECLSSHCFLRAPSMQSTILAPAVIITCFIPQGVRATLELKLSVINKNNIAGQMDGK